MTSKITFTETKVIGENMSYDEKTGLVTVMTKGTYLVGDKSIECEIGDVVDMKTRIIKRKKQNEQ